MQSNDTSTSVGNSPRNDSSAPSQQASGGSGGEQLTHSSVKETGETRHDARTDQPISAPEGNRQASQPASDATAANRTAQDTRAKQAGSTGTGLGAAETGGNQDEFDMPKE